MRGPHVMRSPRRILVVLACAVTVAGPAEASAGSIGVQLLDVPTTARLDPRARLYIVDHVAPGTVVRRRIQVSNATASTTRVAIYPAAATIAKGTFVGAAGHARHELSSWTSVRPGSPDIAAHKRLTAVVRITVPRDAAPGERYGVVWAEARSTPSAGGGITQVSRVGIRVYLSVGPGGPPAADFTIDSLTARRSPDGRPVVLASVHNTGGRALDMNGTLRLRNGPGGLSAGPYPADLGVTLAIGDTEPVEIALDKRLPAGPWDAQVTLRSGLLDRSRRATITFPGAAASSSGPHLVVLGVLGLLGLLLALAGLLIVRVRKTAEGANEPTGTHLGRGHRARLRRRAARRAVRAARR
jgi:hypothetical protein